MKKDSKLTKKKKQVTAFEERLKSFGSLLMTLVVVLFIQSFFIQGYSTPTGSMLNTILIGDKMFFNQFLYGGSTPRNIPFTEIRLPYFRLPAIREPRRDDIVNFDFPGYRDELETSSKVQYLKRLVGQPGDVIEIKNRVLSVNGELFPESPTMMFQYFVRVNPSKMTPQNFYTMINSNDFLKKFEIPDNRDDNPRTPDDFKLLKDSLGQFALLSVPNNQLEALKKEPYISEVSPYIQSKAFAEPEIFPLGSGWNRDNYGPLKVPAKGDVITVTKDNFTWWDTFIKREGHRIELRGAQVFIDGQPGDKYTVQENYYFAVGDNRHNSLDSRFWGFVPRENIVGKAWFVYFYWDSKIPFSKFGELIGSVRLDRIGKPIE
jgi:signal peptidase I